MTIFMPSFSSPARTAWSSEIGTDAAEVFAVVSRLSQGGVRRRLEVEPELVERKLHAPRRGLDDASVRLVREHAVERAGSCAELLAEVSNDLGELADREREDVVPLERELRKLRLRLERDARDGVERKRHARSAGAHDEVLPLPVRPEYRVRGGLR